MKLYEKVFTYGFLIILAGCIFLRIESWPFSDWRVYEYSYTLKNVHYFVIELEKDHQLIEPYTGRGYGMKISDILLAYYEKKDFESIQRECLTIYNNLEKKYRPSILRAFKAGITPDMKTSKKYVCEVGKNNHD